MKVRAGAILLFLLWVFVFPAQADNLEADYLAYDLIFGNPHLKGPPVGINATLNSALPGSGADWRMAYDMACWNLKRLDSLVKAGAYFDRDPFAAHLSLLRQIAYVTTDDMAIRAQRRSYLAGKLEEADSRWNVGRDTAKYQAEIDEIDRVMKADEDRLREIGERRRNLEQNRCPEIFAALMRTAAEKNPEKTLIRDYNPYGRRMRPLTAQERNQVNDELAQVFLDYVRESSQPSPDQNELNRIEIRRRALQKKMDEGVPY